MCALAFVLLLLHIARFESEERKKKMQTVGGKDNVGGNTGYTGNLTRIYIVTCIIAAIVGSILGLVYGFMHS